MDSSILFLFSGYHMFFLKVIGEVFGGGGPELCLRPAFLGWGFPAPAECVSPAQARCFALKTQRYLRLQRTQSKDRRFLKAFAGGYTSAGQGTPQREGRPKTRSSGQSYVAVGGGRKNREEGVTVHQYCALLHRREKMVQECINPIAAGDLKWIYAGYWSRSEQ